MGSISQLRLLFEFKSLSIEMILCNIPCARSSLSDTQIPKSIFEECGETEFGDGCYTLMNVWYISSNDLVFLEEIKKVDQI